MTPPLDLSSVVPSLVGPWATGLIWVAIQFGRGAYHGTLSTRSALAAALEGAGYACALSICAIASAAEAQNLISHGVQQLVLGLTAAAMIVTEVARDMAKPQSLAVSESRPEPAKHSR